MDKLFLITNESVFNYEGKFYCDNIDLKSTPEGLNKKFQIYLIARDSKIKRSHKINLNHINIYKNLISFLIGIFRTFRDNNSKYLVVSITPFTFFACLLIKLFKKKIIVYLRSDGYEEYKSILGLFGPAMYHFMFSIIAKICPLISCRKHILRGRKGSVVSPSQLNSNWFLNHTKPDLTKTNLLYVGRIKVEKGIFSLIEILKNENENFFLSIVGAEKNSKIKIKQDNISIHKIENNEQNLINFYDQHNIFVLPSFTEGHPMALLESLARRRPVIIFKEIEHVIDGKKGIFVAERSAKSFFEKVNFIRQNYVSIQDNMKDNHLPTKEKFLKEISELILNID
tara:strand:+ start:45 stop:1067 length:1023 start_codon:yes stop_codon:yes gene_type:complete